MDMSLWLTSLKWSMTPPHAYKVVTYAAAAAAAATGVFKHNQSLRGLDNRIQASQTKTEGWQLQGFHLLIRLFNKRGKINI